jgi:hypothetical protein
MSRRKKVKPAEALISHLNVCGDFKFADIDAANIPLLGKPRELTVVNVPALRFNGQRIYKNVY